MKLIGAELEKVTLTPGDGLSRYLARDWEMDLGGWTTQQAAD